MKYRFVGYAIVSQDGMLADATGTIPPSLIVMADQQFFMHGLDAAAVLVHGRNSAEQPTSPYRSRLITTRHIPATATITDRPNALLWNPDGASVEEALVDLGVDEGEIAIIGGTDIFGFFLPRYDVFHLTRVPNILLPGGRPVFPDVPSRTPEALLQDAGLTPGPTRSLDSERGVAVVSWQRPA